MPKRWMSTAFTSARDELELGVCAFGFYRVFATSGSLPASGTSKRVRAMVGASGLLYIGRRNGNGRKSVGLSSQTHAREHKIHPLKNP